MASVQQQHRSTQRAHPTDERRDDDQQRTDSACHQADDHGGALEAIRSLLHLGHGLRQPVHERAQDGDELRADGLLQISEAVGQLREAAVGLGCRFRGSTVLPVELVQDDGLRLREPARLGHRLDDGLLLVAELDARPGQRAEVGHRVVQGLAQLDGCPLQVTVQTCGQVKRGLLRACELLAADVGEREQLRGGVL
jgi:hypothetical protein